MKNFLLLLGLLAPVDIEFILDASGSMAVSTEGRSQIDIAKQSIKATIANIPTNVNVALRVYGHRIPKSDKEQSCIDTELAIPFGPLNTQAFSARVDALNPNGYTPIAFSLKEAAKDFLGKESEHVIILVSDGEETCGGDPVAEAKALLAQGFKVTIHTIGFRVDAATKAQLMAISGATGGSYYDAGNAASLTQNLTEAAQKALVIAKEKERARGQEIRGGDQYETAVLIEQGIEYRLDHHQKQNQYDYFYVPLTRGQSMVVTLTTQDHGVDIYGEQAKETINPYAGFRVVGPPPDYQQILDEVIIGTQHGKKVGWALATQEGKHFVLTGNTYHSQHKNSPFKIEIKNHFDANTDTDAQDNIVRATVLEMGDYPSNWIFYKEDVDVYQLMAARGAAYAVKITPPDMESSMEANVYDQDRVRKTSAHSPNRGALLRMENVAFESGGPFYVEVKPYLSNNFPMEYAISVQASGGQPIATEEAKEATPPKPLPEGAVAKTETGFIPTEVIKKPAEKSNTLLYVALLAAFLVIVTFGIIIFYLLTRKKS